MYRQIDDFLTDWKYETEATIKVLKCISDDANRQNIHPDVRSLETLAWHLTQTLTEMGTKAGIFNEDPLAEMHAPESISALTEKYEEYAKQVAKAVPVKWTDSILTEQVDMYGDLWTKGTVLRILISHQAHHRGQMTVIMRALGLPVPGVYGPSKEEWLAFGMDAPQ